VNCFYAVAGQGSSCALDRLAYEGGATVETLLATRFAFAAALFWAILASSGGCRSLRTLARRDVAIALALGGVGYSLQTGAYFAALERIDASLLGLLVYTFPVIVTVAAILLGREAMSRRTTVALLFASAGLVLVLAGAASGGVDALGAALGLTAAVVYSAYILSSEGIARRLGPLVLSTLVCTGSATTLSLAGIVGGGLAPGRVTSAGWWWLVCLSVVSTVGAISLFFAGLSRVGPASASILSTIEPVVTVALAFVVFGESLGPSQLVGGALVLCAVVAVRAPLRVRVPESAQASLARSRA
jgi:drug/metabolite transporter (DMT)-like permease